MEKIGVGSQGSCQAEVLKKKKKKKISQIYMFDEFSKAFFCFCFEMIRLQMAVYLSANEAHA